MNMKKFTDTIFFLCCISIFTILPFSIKADNIKTVQKGKNDIIINENTYYKLSFTNIISSFNYDEIKIEENTYTRLSIEGYGSNFIQGEPKLPVLYKLIEIPVGATININVNTNYYTDYDLKTIGIYNVIYPVQPPVIKSNTDKNPFIINKDIYSRDAFTTDELVKVEYLGTMRGKNLGRLAISPFQYNPVKGILRVYHKIDASINFVDADINKTIEQNKLNLSPYFNNINEKIFNKKISLGTKENIVKTPVKYVIVSPVAYQVTLQPFIEWKTKKGFIVIEAYTNDPQVGNTNVSIKNYLKNLYNAGTPNDPPPSFVLLVGDIDQIPSFNGSTDSHVTDLPYCEYTNDFLPEVYYGRFSCTGVSDLQPQIDKTLEYEQYLMPDDSFLNEVVMVAGYDPSMAPTYGNGQVNYGTSTYFNSSNGINSHTYLYPVSSNSASQIIQNVSDGCAFANYTAHGSSNGWANPSFTISNIASLQNAHKYPLMIGNACVTNKFDDAVCFGEALLRASDKGALGYIGASNNTYWDEDFYWSVGAKTIDSNPVYDANALGSYDRLFHTHGEAFEEWYVTQGEIIFAGNLAVMELSSNYDYYWEIYNLMGDPSLMVYFSVPPQLNCNYNQLIVLGSTTFTVNTEPYAYVAISMNGILHGAALADATGIANITITPFTTDGIVDIIATKQNRKPFFGTVPAASPTGPYMVLNTKSVNDASGNNNSIPEANENILLSVVLNNLGISTAYNVIATLNSNNPYITITDNIEPFGNIDANTTVTATDAFAFTVAGNIPDKNIIDFDLTITDASSNVWNSTFSLTAHAPVLDADIMIIDDYLYGNNNKRLDPGETVNIMIKTFNKGLGDAETTTATLNSTNPHITINNGNFNIGTILSGDYSYAVFNISVSSNAVAGDMVDFVYSAISGQYSVSKNYSTIIGIVTEDWESGNFNKFNWVASGDVPWFINSTSAYEGTYCVQSGSINHQQSSILSITATVTSDDSISFYMKVSSETNYDFLKFYIDNVCIKSWSGILNWQRVAFPVTVGQHKFKWEYAKDYSMSAGDDCAWVDFIQFPPCIITTVSNIPELSHCDINLFPNPAKNSASIQFNLNEYNNVNIFICNSSGKIVMPIFHSTRLSPGNHTCELDLTSFKSGIYYLIFITDNEKITKKISIIK